MAPSNSRTRKQAGSVPDGISETHLSSGRLGPYRGLLPLAVLAAVIALALTGALGGGHDPTTRHASNGAELSVTAPATLRSGMFFEMDIVVEASGPIAKPAISLPRGFIHDLTINTIEPAPAEEGFEDGALTLSYDAMRPGDRLVVKLDGQVNPSLVGTNSGVLAVRDDQAPLVEIPLRLKVLP